MGAETMGEGLEDVGMGNVSEEASEASEKFQQRLAAVQAKLKKLAKDEKKAKGFDGRLAAMIRSLDPQTLAFVVFLIDHDVSSLTILAMISLRYKEAWVICHTEFHKHIEEHADFSEIGLPAKIEEQVSHWWTFLFAADFVSDSKLTALHYKRRSMPTEEKRPDHETIPFITHQLWTVASDFLDQSGVKEFEGAKFEKMSTRYAKELFEAEK